MPIQSPDGTVRFVDAAEAQTLLTPHVKAECERRILAIMPAWKQRNVIADLWSDNVEVEAAAAVEWAKVTALRTKSNEIEASIASMTDEQILNFNAQDDAHWSE
tara:strand:- start:2416 stop:2727 length:312 start_codon:yes stop_codon:yes gene_type:complete